MEIAPQTVAPPAYNLKNRLQLVKLAVFTALFGCQHPNPSLPRADFQVCPDCGAERDYIFSMRWRSEYRDILRQWQAGDLGPVEFARNFHQRLQDADAAFIGEWRKGGL